MAGKVYGIDLGTTNSAIAECDGDEVRIIKNTDGYETTPSAVFFTGEVNGAGEDEALVGIQAKNSAAMDPDHVVQFIKRFMGESYTVQAPSGREYTPEMISAMVLRKLAQGVEQYEGEGAVKDVVITVPAYFDDARRTATKQAGAIAGLNVVRVLNEPTAAAIAFGLDAEQDGKALVYDLGGGTFDVTIMQIRGKSFDVIATGGDSELGGVDFDNKIMGLIREQLEAEGVSVSDEDDALLADIQEKAEKAKLQLSGVERAKVPFTIGGKTHRVEITRQQFEEAAEPLMQRTQFLLEDVMEQAGVSWGDIDHVLAVGGSSRMPMVKAQLERLSGRPVTYKVDPDTAVAQGAAIFASNLKLDRSGQASVTSDGSSVLTGITISDVTSQSLGVITVDPHDHSQHMNSIIIPHNTKIPTKKSQTYVTVSDNQTAIKVDVTEGDDPEVEYVRVIGTSTVSIPPHPAGSPVEIIYAYDPDQTIFVEVIDKLTGKSLGTFEVERTANLNNEQVRKATGIVSGTTVD